MVLFIFYLDGLYVFVNRREEYTYDDLKIGS